MRNKLLLLAILIFTSNYGFCQFSSSSFASKVPFSTTNSVQGITLGDLNNDGKKELITANLAAGSSIGVYINNSTTGVINSSIYSSSFLLSTLSSYAPINVNVADLNGDSKQDIIVTYSSSSNNQFSVFINQYNGISLSSSSFSRIDITAGSTPQGSAIADFDLDGKPDVAIANAGSNSVSVFKNTSTGGTLSFALPVSYSTGTGPSSMTFGDIDNDGKMDMATSNWGGSTITVLRNTNSTTGVMSFTSQNFSVQTQPNAISINDFDNNGLKEVICTNYGSNSISIYANTSSSGISFATRIDLTVSPYQYTQGLAIADYDGDGKVDLGVTFAGSPAFLLAKNIYTSGAITALSFSSFTAYATDLGPVGLVSGDLDGDLRPDVVSGNYTAQNVSVLKNRMLASEPTIATTSIASIPTTNSVTLNFTKGNGTRRLIIAKSSSSLSVAPLDTNFYTSSSIFGSGTNIGSNNYVVYSDTGSSATITGLAFGQTYNFTIYEYNGIGGYSNYLTSTVGNITQLMGDAFYSKSTGALNLLSTWGPNTDGTGTSPSTFYNANTVFIVANNPGPTLTANWIVSGTNSFVIVGDGVNALNFTIPSGSSLYSDSVAVRANATLTFIGGLIGNKAFFDTLSIAQFTSSTAQNIPGFTYYNIVMANSQKTITNNCNIRSVLNLLCNLNTGIYTITLGTSGTQVGILNRNASGTITGRFKRWFGATTNTGNSGLFPMLVGANYRPSLVEFTSAPSTAGTLTSEFFAVPPGNIGLYIYDFSVGFVEVNKAANSGYWKIDAIGLTGGTYTLTLTGTGFYGISLVADLRIIKRQTSGAWTLPSGSTAIAGTGSTSAPIVGRSGYVGFGEFTIGGDSTANSLPVTWLSFEGKRNANGVILNWRTAQEINNAYFIVERKTSDNKQFETIGKLLPNKQAGVNSYNWLDSEKNIKFPSLYRIRQVDLNGITSTTNEISIYNKDEEQDFLLWPSPATNIININGVSDNEIVVLTSLSGQQFEISIIKNTINVSELPRGFYLLTILEKSSNTVKFSKKLLLE